MRHRVGIAGATLIYGRRQDRPDLLLAAQFLIDDLRQEGRTISGVRITRHAMRLRADGLELALSLTDRPIPPGAFVGAVRPLVAGAAVPDMARGRVLHALRHHHWVLGLLLRPRGVQEGQSMAARLQALPVTCHALSAAVAEAAPPLVVVWQANGLVCTLGEFLGLPAGMLDEAGRGLMPLGPVGQGRLSAARPVMPGQIEPAPAPVRPRRAIMRAHADLPLIEAPPLPGSEGQRSARDPAAAALPSIDGPCGSLPGKRQENERVRTGRRPPPASRSARAERQSRGRLFEHKSSGGRVTLAAAPGLARHDASLAGAMRRRDGADAISRATFPKRCGAALRVALICVALALFGPAAAGGEVGRNGPGTQAPQGKPEPMPEAR